MQISQRKFIEKVLSKFNMADCKYSAIPTQPKLHIEPSASCKKVLPYKELIGCLMYLMMGIRADLSFLVSYFSKFQNCYDTIHLKNLKHVLRYPNKTKDICLQYGRSNGAVVYAFVDADSANDPHDRKNVNNFFTRVFGNNVIWKSKKQPCVSLSSTEAEYIMSVRGLVFGINHRCIRCTTKPSKHVSVKHHFVKDIVQDKVLKLVYVDSHNQVAYVLIKALPYSKFQYYVTGLGMSELGEVFKRAILMCKVAL
ncbi:hypothetical protein PR048_010186 [Dryococelus australis]|uniref:Uncharacterized protein n=1 Tax=Dryococelus australis TaxID=614101 RepID=A0ABQ9I2F5_9NEOP|nr:hypothetical protein PR048_010186 [Dryococelus australis]